jgi:hypothetical protein
MMSKDELIDDLKATHALRVAAWRTRDAAFDERRHDEEMDAYEWSCAALHRTVEIVVDLGTIIGHSEAASISWEVMRAARA